MSDSTFSSEVAHRYDRWYETRWGKYADQRQRQLLAHMCEQPGEQVLDVGCGTGRYLQWFAEMGIEATGVDNSAEMVRVARQRLAGSGEEGRVLLADATDLPFANDSFDLVTAITVLEFVDRPGALIREMLRISRDRIFLGVLNSYSPYYLQQRLRRGRILSQAHFYSVGEVVRLVREAGGEDVIWRTTLQGPAIGPPVLHHISRLRDCLPGLASLPWGAYIGVGAQPAH